MRAPAVVFPLRYIGTISQVRLLLILLWLTCGLPMNTGCTATSDTSQEDTSYTAARNRMVIEQIKKRGIQDERVLHTLTTVPRHLFIPPAYRDHAYDDGPLPIGQGQTISQPYIVALMSERLELSGDERVLEIGTGSGYQAAVLSLLAKQVYSIEIVPQLMSTASQLLAQLGYDNVTVLLGDGNVGWEKEKPYDAIIVTAAAPHIPPALIEQLAEGGRMVLPVVRGEEQYLLRLRKQQGRIVEEDLGLVRFVPLVGGAS